MSMSDADAHKALEVYFDNNWTETDKFFQQVPAFQDVRTEFVVFKVLFASANAMSIAGDPKFRTSLLVEVSINIPARTGTRRAVELGDQVSNLFLGKEIEGITFRDKMVYQTAIEDWYRMVVSFNGYYDYDI